MTLTARPSAALGSAHREEERLWSAPAIPLQDHLVLCDSDRLRVLNPTARRLWEIGRETQDPVRVVAWLIESYGLPLTQAEQDVKALFASAVAADPPPTPASSPSPATRRPRPPTSGGYQSHYQLYDRPFSLYCATAELACALEPLFAHLGAGAAAGPRFAVETDAGFTGWCDQDWLFASATLDGAVIGLFAAVLEYAVAGRDILATLHAGAVSDGHRCLVLPGAGGSGKSTLTAALLTCGYRYLSDDLAPLENGSSHVLPAPVCLNLKAGSVPALTGLYPELPQLPVWRSGTRRLRFLPPPAFAQRRPERAYPVAAVVFPQYQPDAALKLEPLDPVAVLTRLMASGARFELPLDPAKVAALCAWIEATPACALTYSRLEQAVAVAAERLRSW